MLPKFLTPYLAEIQETCRGGAHSGGQGVTFNGCPVFGKGGVKSMVLSRSIETRVQVSGGMVLEPHSGWHRVPDLRGATPTRNDVWEHLFKILTPFRLGTHRAICFSFNELIA